MSSDNHLRAILQDIIQLSITKTSLNIICQKFNSNLQGPNELQSGGISVGQTRHSLIHKRLFSTKLF